MKRDKELPLIDPQLICPSCHLSVAPTAQHVNDAFDGARIRIQDLEARVRVLEEELRLAHPTYCYHTCPASGPHEATCQDITATLLTTGGEG